MKVVIYVEGASDKAALTTLLRDLLERKGERGIQIEFYESPQGNKKKTLLEKVPLRAANILLNAPETIVVALPDLYPKNVGFDHETPEQLIAGVSESFRSALQRMRIDDERIVERFKVFCLKHDLEALILAAEEPLAQRLGTKKFAKDWTRPVEDQNNDKPPKRVVEQLFALHGQFYREAIDAPLILGRADYRDIAERCDQCFKPFVEFLEGL